jgi:hypothetical protein
VLSVFAFAHHRGARASHGADLRYLNASITVRVPLVAFTRDQHSKSALLSIAHRERIGSPRLAAASGSMRERGYASFGASPRCR